MSKASTIRLSLFALCLMAGGACTVRQTEAPELAGPSEFALSFALAATPDAISHDGGSQSAIVVTAYDSTGTPKPGVTFRLDMRVGGQPVDYGTLSGKTIVTGADGRATATYTAPPPLPAGANIPTCSPSIFSPQLPGSCVQIVATPIGSGFSSASSQAVDIHLLPLGVILPPASTPTAQFTFTPTAPAANTPVQFDASASCAGSADAGGGCGSASGSIVTYAWNFGDGATGTGRLASHSFANAQSYNVTLTVTNDRGIAASITKPVTMGAGSAPTAAFVFSPIPVVVNAEVFFDASNSRPGLGHTIVSYKWNWGDNESAPASSSPLQDHDYTAPGTYTVVLTVTDEAGQIGTASQTIAVSAGNPIADFSFVVENSATHTMAFDARSSTAAGTATITDYSWLFGDGTPGASLGSTPSHAFPILDPHPSTYTVRLTVTDSTGKVGVVSKSVIVP